MKFLIISQYYPPEIGAPQVRLAAVTKALVAKGHTVEIVTALPNHPTGNIFSEYKGRVYTVEKWNGCRLHRVWVYAALGAGFHRIVNYLSFAFLACMALIRVQKPDVVFVESPPPFVMVPVVFINWFWRAKLILNIADLWPDSITEMGLMREGVMIKSVRLFERWCYRKAHTVNAVTEGIRDRLICDKGLSEAKVLFFPNGVDTAMFSPREPDKTLLLQMGLAGKRTIVYAGTLGFAQGLDVILDAMLEIAVKLPDVFLVFIGDGSERIKLTQISEHLTLSNVMFLPPQPPEFVARLYSIAVAGIASLKPLQLFEGARPSKIFPIMASGKPVIYSGAGECARLILNAQAGIVAPPGNAAALANAIEALFSDPSKMQQCGQNGREYVVNNLSWDRIINDWLSKLTIERQHSDA